MTDNIQFSDNPAVDLKAFLQQKNYSKVAVLTDANTTKLCYPRLREALPTHEIIEVPSGEEYKNLGTCESIWQKMTSWQMDRHAVLVIIGGGVVGDMGGFCAATYKRGIDFILIPTTLLSQVDAALAAIPTGELKHAWVVLRAVVNDQVLPDHLIEV